MINKLLQKGFTAWFLSAVLVLSAGSIMAQNTDNLGGPYEPDSATVLLMHFNGDLVNEAGTTPEAVKHGNINYITDSDFPFSDELGTAVYLDNDARTDSSFITIPDTTTEEHALDLQGDWTIETWVQAYTYGADPDSWRYHPRIMFKPGVDFYAQSNYFLNFNGSLQDFRTGYFSEERGSWTAINSPNNLMTPGEWFHITFIRDTSKNVVVQMIHKPTSDGGLELVNFDSQSFPDGAPLTNNNPLYIGSAPQIDNAFLDGFLDELRVSNVVRNFPVPPVITNVSNPATQLADTNYVISASMQTLGDATIENPELNYRVNEGSWNTLSMNAVDTAENMFSASIPGQQVGDNVEYYVYAETNTGLNAYNPANAIQADTLAASYSFGITQENSKTLQLSFEEEAGSAPVDSSEFGNQGAVVGNPEYVEGKSGQAMSFDGDSTYIRFDSPYLSSEKFTVDFWFMAQDTLPESGDHLLINESSTWFQDTQRIRFLSGGIISSATYVPGRSDNNYASVETDTAVSLGEWYRFIYTYDHTGDSLGLVQLRNADNEVIDQKTFDVQYPPITSSFPLYLGGTPSNDQYFNGLMDEVKMYNYIPEEYQDIMIDDTTGTDIQEGISALPEKVTLGENYPNPFNPTTKINYSLPQASEVQLKVYNMLGREVATLVDSHKGSGKHEVKFNARDMASGMYFYRLQADNTTITKKMLLVK